MSFTEMVSQLSDTEIAGDIWNLESYLRKMREQDSGEFDVRDYSEAYDMLAVYELERDNRAATLRYSFDGPLTHNPFTALLSR